MTINSMFQFLVPKDKQFFPLFQQASYNISELSIEVERLAHEDLSNRDLIFQKICIIKEKSKAITHTINLELSKSYLTPFDREDIYMLASGIDGIVTQLSSSASRIQRYKITHLVEPIKELTKINTACVRSIEPAISNLEKKILIKDIIAETSKLEDEADNVYNNALDYLFANVNDAIEIIKHKEILKALEKVSDQCKHVAEIIEMIVVKHS
jgi:uncharacterized protein